VFGVDPIGASADRRVPATTLIPISVFDDLALRVRAGALSQMRPREVGVPRPREVGVPLRGRAKLPADVLG
jgi:hypothetical protein